MLIKLRRGALPTAALALTLLVGASFWLTGCAPSVADDADVEPLAVEDVEPQQSDTSPVTGDYPIVDTGQVTCYDENGIEIASPSPGEATYGQDAQYAGNQPSYTDNGDGTVSDDVTGLMWARSADLSQDGTIDSDDKLTYDEALIGATEFELGGYDDWRLPSIKELYSLMDFRGIDPSGPNVDSSTLKPFIDTDYFDFAYGDESAGERIIDAQFASATKYVSTTMNGADTMFGLNLADGRIKGYPTGPMPGSNEGKGFYVLYVRGNTDYGVNAFVDNEDGTITDEATGLMWSRDDSGVGMDWVEALAYIEELNAEEYLGYSDWRLPNVKELHSIVDYSRAPDSTDSAAIDPIFDSTPITNEAGQTDWACYWSSTTHVNTSSMPGANAAYVAFGRAMGYWQGSWTDVHGAGAQRSDPKTGSAAEWPQGHGPQGDAIRIDNFVRAVRDAG